VGPDPLEACAEWAGESPALRGLGGALRVAAVRTVTTDALSGLAGGVTSRVKAEDQQSWTASWNRVFEDWHWVAVGLGAVTAAMAMCTLASLMLYSSISQLMQMNARAGTLYLIALPEGGQGEPVVMQYEESLSASVSNPTKADALAMPASFGWQAERALVAALDNTLSRNGRTANLRDLPILRREEIRALLQAIPAVTNLEPARRPGGLTIVSGMHLVMTTSVVASGI